LESARKGGRKKGGKKNGRIKKAEWKKKPEFSFFKVRQKGRMGKKAESLFFLKIMLEMFCHLFFPSYCPFFFFFKKIRPFFTIRPF
jgi:hypothetical protein